MKQRKIKLSKPVTVREGNRAATEFEGGAELVVGKDVSYATAHSIITGGAGEYVTKESSAPRSRPKAAEASDAGSSGK